MKGSSFARAALCLAALLLSCGLAAAQDFSLRRVSFREGEFASRSSAITIDGLVLYTVDQLRDPPFGPAMLLESSPIRLAGLRPRMTPTFFKFVFEDRFFGAGKQVFESFGGNASPISLTPQGNFGNGGSRYASVSDDARFAAFESDASNLIVDDTNGVTDVFVRDLTTSVTTRVSVDAAGGQLQNASTFPMISPDGRFVAFVNESIGGLDSNRGPDVWLKDLSTGDIRLVSSVPGGTSSTGQSILPAVSRDAAFIAFVSDAPNLTAGDVNGTPDLFVWDRLSGTNRRVGGASLAPGVHGGFIEGSPPDPPAIDGDGRFVAWVSAATDVIPGDDNGVADVFVWDRLEDRYLRANVSDAGVEANAPAFAPAISAGGEFVSFTSAATNLFPTPDPGSALDVFVKDTFSLGPPAPPANLTVTPQAGRNFLAWEDDSGNETGFEIQRADQSAPASYQRISLTGSNSTTLNDLTRQAGAPYLYRVRAFNAFGTSQFTDPVPVVSTSNPPVPPSAVAATVLSPTEVQLTWQDNSSDEDGFRIHRRLGNGQELALATVPTNLARFTDATATQGTTITYGVSAFSRSGASGIVRAAPVTTPLPAPTRLTVETIGSTRAALTWVDESVGETGFQIEVFNGQSFIASGSPLAANRTFGTVEGTAEATLRVRIRALKGIVASSPSNEVLVRFLAAPDQLAAAAFSTSRIDLTWRDRSAGEDAYVIQRKASTGGNFVEVGRAGRNAVRFSDTNLQPGKTFAYRVLAAAVGVSSPSNEATATTLPNPPPAPRNLTATVDGTTVSLAWTDPSVSEEGFQLERRADGAFIRIALLDANVITFSDSQTAANRTYVYRVRGTNAGGASAYSNTVSATTLAAPAEMTAVALSPTQTQLTWTDRSEGETGFEVQRSLQPGPEGDWSRVLVTPPNARTAVDSGLQPETTYHYRVRALRSGSVSDFCPDWPSTTTLPEKSGRLEVPESLHFGIVLSGQTSTRRLVIRNQSAREALSVTVTGISTPFGVRPNETFALPPKGKRVLEIAITPSSHGVTKGRLRLSSTDPHNPTVVVKLVAIIQGPTGANRPR